MAVRGNNGGVGEAEKVGGREIGNEHNRKETTIKMNLTKQEKYKAMGKFACFVHRWPVWQGVDGGGFGSRVYAFGGFR